MRSIRARLRFYVPSDIDEEMREESTKLIEEAADHIEALETALREIKQLALNCQPAETPAALAHMVRICIDAGIARIALAPEQEK